jgi:hypothetical protein
MVPGDHRARRGGFGRPVGMSAVLAAMAWLLLVASVSAHGGVPTLQLNTDRINPGGTVELRGDMTGDEPVELSLQAADGSTLALGSIETDWEGHFVAALTMPIDVAAGTYVVQVKSPFEEATTKVVVAGPPLAQEGEGQPLGRDEALAGQPIAVASAAAGQPAAQWIPPPGADSSIRVIGAVIVVALVLVVAFGLGRVARLRARRT